MINKIGEKYTRFDKDNNKSVFKTILRKDLVVVTVYIHVYINSSGERKGIHFKYSIIFYKKKIIFYLWIIYINIYMYIVIIISLLKNLNYY